MTWQRYLSRHHHPRGHQRPTVTNGWPATAAQWRYLRSGKRGHWAIQREREGPLFATDRVCPGTDDAQSCDEVPGARLPRRTHPEVSGVVPRGGLPTVGAERVHGSCGVASDLRHDDDAARASPAPRQAIIPPAVPAGPTAAPHGGSRFDTGPVGRAQCAVRTGRGSVARVG